MFDIQVITPKTRGGCDSTVVSPILLHGAVRRWDVDSTVAMTPRYWNMWWTFTMVAAVVTLLVVILEAFGILQDLGLALAVAGVLVTTVFGLTASTRSSLTGFRGDVVPRLDRIITLLEERLPRTTT